MFAVVKINESTQNAIAKGELFIGNGHQAFEKREEAQHWAEVFHSESPHKVVELCKECEEGSYLDDPSHQYPTRKRVLKTVKVKSDEA